MARLWLVRGWRWVMVRAAGPAVLGGFAAAATATGPIEQRLPWRPGLTAGQYSTLNSVVQIETNLGFGSGSVIGKRHDARTNTDWLCVLTADHVVRGASNLQVRFGDQAEIATFGGAHTAGVASATTPSWHMQLSTLDVAIVAVQINADPRNGDTRQQFFDRLQPLSMISGLSDPRTIVDRNETFTQVGYGRTATSTITAPGATAGTGMQTIPRDNNRRFQNNRFERYRGAAASGYDGGIYYQDTVDYFFNIPAATGFLAGEGLGYAGDSGGPALYNQLNTQNVPAFARDTPSPAPPGPGTPVPQWAGGDMTILDNIIAGVFVYGNSNDATDAISRYDTSFGGFVPLTPDRVAFIEGICAVVPAPGTGGALALGLVLAVRRRRDRRPRPARP